MNHSNNSRIAKNTLFLYFRMLFILVITLYTSRVVLKTLGVEDYGIFNVVGGIVTMFGFLNSTMATTTQRYISFSLGKEEYDKLSSVFSTCVLSHILIAIIILMLLESFGCWFLFNKLVIPTERLVSAFWVFQSAVISAIIGVMSVPYNSDIIAHEKMSAFAYISIVEVILKLIIVYVLQVIAIDKLMLYGMLLLVVQMIVTSAYVLYCRKNFYESRCKVIFERKLFKELFSFAGWNIYGSLASVLFNQGLSILLNIFFGPVINAAKGVANQVDGAIKQFSVSFQMALNPQITKTYASGDLTSMHMLICRSSRFTFFLLLVISLPILLETQQILNVWLGVVPKWTVSFVRILILIGIIDAVSNPMMTSAAATGKVKTYQSVVGGILLLIVPISYVILLLGGNPNSVFFVHLFMGCIAFCVRLFLIKKLVGLSIGYYLKDVVFRCLLVCFISVLPSALVKLYTGTSIGCAFFTIIFSCAFASLVSFFVGLTKTERHFVLCKIDNLVCTIKKYFNNWR